MTPHGLKQPLPEITEQLIRWYPTVATPLPWRDAPTPYHVWISEIMLQQTRIAAVIPYYLRWMERFPTVEALAAASEEEVLKHWEGLGYYSRARNIHRCAALVCQQHGGALPSTPEQLQRLPGIGAYTAGAIASICFGAPAPAVDGNVLRVMARLLADDRDITEEKTKKAVHALLAQVYPEGPAAGVLTQALMELGQRVCTPTSPRCAACPCRDLCLARRGGLVELLPARSPKKPRQIEERTVLLLFDAAGRVAVLRRRSTGLLAGLYEFPTVAGHRSPTEALAEIEAMGYRAKGAAPLPAAKHIFTHLEWHMLGYIAYIEGVSPAPGHRFVSAEELRHGYPFPTALRVYRDIALEKAALGK